MRVSGRATAHVFYLPYTMGPSSINANGYPSALNGHYADSMPASSTPTLDISFDRATSLGDLSVPPVSFSGAVTPPAPPLWPHRLSASFSAMADQIAAASQALALVPSTAFSGSDVGAELCALRGRLEGIEQTQAKMASEFEALKTQFTTLDTERGKAEEEAQAGKLEELEKKLDALSETVTLE